MQPFGYKAPSSVDAAVKRLAEAQGRARPLAGGTDLLVKLRRETLDLDLVVDVKRIPALKEVAYHPEDGLTVGAAASCAEVGAHAAVRQHYPGLWDAVSLIGGPAIQNRATVGGNLCNAAPSADAIPMMIVLGARARVSGPDGERRIPVVDFCTGPGETVLHPDELLVSLHFAPPEPHTGAAYRRFTPRGEMDIAVAGAGAWVKLDAASNEIVDARIALAAVAPIPLPVVELSEVLGGRVPNEEAIEAAAAQAQACASPIDDMRGTAAQRRHLVGVLVRRALGGAIRRAQGQVGDERAGEV
jgi:carbon-monoxide dehydrogenase medium subunit